MGTHPIFESDFDCLTVVKSLKCLIIQLSVNKSKQKVTPSSLMTLDLSTPIALVNAGSITPITTVVWLLDNKMERILSHVPTSRINFQICPLKWTEEFDDQRANRCFPAKIYSMEPANSVESE